MMRKHSRLSLASLTSFSVAFGLSVAYFCAASSAAPINYGDFSDFPPGAVMYTDVTESSGTDPVPLYGAPTLSLNVLEFDPQGFVATSAGGPLDVTDGQLNFGIDMAPGSGLDGMFIGEAGDYSFAGTGGTGTSVSSSLSVRVDILEVDDVPLTTPIVVTATSTFSTDMLATGGPVGLTPWGNGLFADFGPSLTATLGSFDRGVTKAEVVIDNQLVTNSEEDSLAFIAKKDFRLVPTGDLIPIPEPSTAIAGLIFTGLGVLHRRRVA